MFSLLVNGLILTLLLSTGLKQFEPSLEVLPVTFELPQPESKELPKQIVSPSEEQPQAATPPKEARYESDKDLSTPKEQIKRGDPLVGGAPLLTAKKNQPQKPSEKKAAPIKDEPQQESTEPAPKLRSLKLGAQELLSQTEASEAQKKAELEKQLSAKIANSNPGTFGSNDYLPSLPDGDITMLNAKANQYAVFVRRVAQQVFGHIRQSGFTSLPISSLQSIETPVRFRAVLSPTGSLMRIEPVFSSHESNFDKLIEKGVKAGASDPNPPKGAAAKDGLFYFLFEAQARGWVEPNPRTGMLGERRWLMLSTGLE